MGLRIETAALLHLMKKSVAKKILICGGNRNLIPQEFADIETFFVDRFPNIKPTVEHVVILADWYTHTKQDYILKHYLTQKIHVVHGGRTRIREALSQIVSLVEAAEAARSAEVERYVGSDVCPKCGSRLVEDYENGIHSCTTAACGWSATAQEVQKYKPL